jgi:hypothetical protein
MYVLYFRIDFDKHRAAADFSFPLLELIGKYDAKGRILLLPLNGNGDLNITLGKERNNYILSSCFGPYLKENAIRHKHKDKMVVFNKMADVYSENNMKYINITCGKNAELLDVKTGDTYNYQ